MRKSPIANWQPQTAQGWQHAKLLSDHTAKKRGRTAAKSNTSGAASSNAASAPAAPGKKRPSVDSRKLWHVAIPWRRSLPTDERWAFEMSYGQPVLLTTGSHDASEEMWEMALALATPESRIDGNCRSGTLRSALQTVGTALAEPIPIWIPPHSCWLGMWLPTCGLIEEAEKLLEHNQDLAAFPRLFLPATWLTARRRGGAEEGAKYRGWKQALKDGEFAQHWGCYVLVYLDSPAQRIPLYESTVARLRLAGHGVVQLDRGVVFQPIASLILHQQLTDQPLVRVPQGQRLGRTGTHLTFRKERELLVFPAQDDQFARTVVKLQLSDAEQQQFDLLQQRTVAPFNLNEESHQ